MIIIPRVERAWAQMLGKAPSRCRAKPLQRLLFSEGDKPFVIDLSEQHEIFNPANSRWEGRPSHHLSASLDQGFILENTVSDFKELGSKADIVQSSLSTHGNWFQDPRGYQNPQKLEPFVQNGACPET